MPRLKRSERKKQTVQEAAPVRQPSRSYQVAHLRCPVCSLQARKSLIEAGPYLPSVARTEEYGGYGNISWSPGEQISEEERLLLVDKLESALQTLKGGRGSRRKKEQPDVVVVEHEQPMPAEPAIDIEALKSRLTDLMNEDKKANSIEKLDRAILGIDADRVDNVEDLEDKIQKYKDINRSGMSLDEYQSKKQSAWDEILEAIDELSLKEEE